MLIGAPGLLYAKAGAAYVFVLSNQSWELAQEVTAPDGAAGDNYGWSVSLSGDTAVIGAPNTNSGTGAAYVVTPFNGNNYQQELVASDGGLNHFFGWSVSLSGTTALIGQISGGAGAGPQNAGVGAAYVFVQGSSAWTQAAELTAPDYGLTYGQPDFVADFGYSASLSGSTALIGACSGAGGNGSAYVFTGMGSSWTLQQELRASDGAPGDNFGCSVSVSGTTAFIGAPYHSLGASYVFTETGGVWALQQELMDPDGGLGQGFGWSVSLSGSSAFIGAVGNTDVGLTYVFALGTIPRSPQPRFPTA